MINPFDLIDFAILTRAELSSRKPSQNFYPSEASVIYRDKYGDVEVGGCCLRKSWYRMNGYEEKPTTPYSQWIFQAGHNFEDNVHSILNDLKKKFDAGALPEEKIEWLQNNPEGNTPFKWIDFLLSGEGLIIEPEHKFFVDIHGIPVKGALDFVAVDPSSSTGKTFWELKTAHGYYAAKEIFGNASTTGMPKLSQMLQAFLYAIVFDKDGEFEPKMVSQDEEGNTVILDETSPHRFDGGWMLYLLRDDMTRGPHRIELHKEDGNIYPKINGNPMKFFGLNEMVDRWKNLKSHLEGDAPPPRDFSHEYATDKIESYYAKGKLSKKKYTDWQRGHGTPGDWNCAYCPFEQFCKLDRR